ncbi:hypothetical protein [Novosphingobium pentaromativorans]|uniref:Uncharacterized protein n=1 Tax=Novosphingobium pentaromativorans US6-1 TaxID=1088721 RepID=G6EJH0_9SPHN|nr:hypothetical protein [Novosphingobium pentaromativorans]EHJ58549.1 hypothetical protein NSU_4491 [Novosphingobium pentaromativorans US6-1]
MRPFAWILIGLAMLIWSLLSWLLYSFTDPVLAWLATSLDLVVDRGQDTAKTLGNKSAGDILAALDTSSLPGQLLGMLKSTGKGAVVVIWVIGMAALAILPIGLSLIGRFYVRGRH